VELPFHQLKLVTSEVILGFRKDLEPMRIALEVIHEDPDEHKVGPILNAFVKPAKDLLIQPITIDSKVQDFAVF
jgi:hypothetical protein